MTVDELIAKLQRLSTDGRGGHLVFTDSGCEVDGLVTDHERRLRRVGAHALIVAPEEAT